MQAELREFAAFHFATHGHVDRAEPRRSGIALSPSIEDSGFFTIANVPDLDLDANLVVLSACETTLGVVGRGEGVQPLPRAFRYAGARGVIASLRKVSDRAASETLVQLLHEQTTGRGKPPETALSEAKRSIRESHAVHSVAVGDLTGDAEAATPAAHPYFCARFIHTRVHN